MQTLYQSYLQLYLQVSAENFYNAYFIYARSF